MKKHKWTGGIPFKLRVGVGTDAVIFEGNALGTDFDDAFRQSYQKVKGIPSDEVLKKMKVPIGSEEEDKEDGA